MQSKVSEVQKYNYMQIYLTEEELEKQETKELIEKYKKQKYKLGIFVAGDVRSKKIRQLTTAINDGTVAALNVIDYLSSNKE